MTSVLSISEHPVDLDEPSPLFDALVNELYGVLHGTTTQEALRAIRHATKAPGDVTWATLLSRVSENGLDQDPLM